MNKTGGLGKMGERLSNKLNKASNRELKRAQQPKEVRRGRRRKGRFIKRKRRKGRR